MEAWPLSSSFTAVSLAAVASRAAAWSPGPDRSMKVADIVSITLFLAVCFPVFIVLIALACLRLFRPPDDELPRAADTSSSEWSLGGPGDGLDAAAIAALPLVFYRDVRRHRGGGGGGGGGGDALECAVCLLEFGDDDALRLLPTCPHAFHPECIGLWLEKHVTCPLCRASLLDAPAPAPREEPPLPQQQQETAASPPQGSPPVHDHETVVTLTGDADDEDGSEEADERARIQRIARTRRAAGRQALPRSNSTGHERAGGVERFALRLPEHVRMEILMSHRLRHVTSAVASVRVREGSAHGHDGGGGGSVRSAMARLLSLFVSGDGWKRDDEDKSGAGRADWSSRRQPDDSALGGGGEEKRSEATDQQKEGVQDRS